MVRMTVKVLVSILLAGVVAVTATPLQNDEQPQCAVSAPDRLECGWFGINEQTCTGRGCCWDSTVPNAKYCFFKKGTQPQCALAAPDRVECGWHGINEETCLARGCCWDSTVPNAKYCFVKKGAQMPPEMCPIKPADREDCGYFGITKDECVEKGCCWDPTVPNTKFCYYRKNVGCHIYAGTSGECRYSCLPGEHKAAGKAECKGTLCCYK